MNLSIIAPHNDNLGFIRDLQVGGLRQIILINLYHIFWI